MVSTTDCSVLMSVRPKWCELVASEKKTLEIRKSRPSLDAPFTVYIYQTRMRWVCDVLRGLGRDNLAEKLENSLGMVIGEFVCDAVDPFEVFDNGSVKDWLFLDLAGACVDYNALATYVGAGNRGWAWHIGKLTIYDKAKPLSEFRRYSGFKESVTLTRPPQSWCYVEPLQDNI